MKVVWVEHETVFLWGVVDKKYEQSNLFFILNILLKLFLMLYIYIYIF